MKKVLFVFIIVLSLILIDGFFINTSGFIVKEETINVNNLPDSFINFKIMQISDTLIKSSDDLKRIKDVVKKVNSYKPDIIVFTGDLLDSKNKLSDSDIKTLTSYLSNLECDLYKYAVIGDNDLNNIDTYKSILDDAKFNILDNASTLLFYKDKMPIKLSGITNTDNLSESLDISDNIDTALNIVLTHYSDNFNDLKNENIDLVLAGNSLHGQINIPFYGGLIKFKGSSKYVNEYYKENDKELYISSGIGTNNINFRLFNKPSINLYILDKN